MDSAPDTASAGTLAEMLGAAVAQHNAGALDDAERRYRRILALSPDHADTLQNLGLIALQRGDATSAVDLIGKAISANDRVAEYHYNMALAWRALHRLDQTGAHLERAIEIRNDYALAHLNLGNVRREQGRLTDAVTSYERAIALAPNSPAPRLNLAGVFSQQGRYDDAIACYRQVLALEPNHAETHSRLGDALMARGRTSDAIAHFESAAALAPNLPAMHENLAAAYLSAGKFELALDAASRALEKGETPQGKAIFAQCVKFARFRIDNGRFRKLVLRAFTEGWGPPRELTGVCLNLIKLNPVVNGCIVRANSAWPARLPATELFGSSGVFALLEDQLLRSLLECDPVTELGLERFLTNMRHVMLTASTTEGAKDTPIDERLLALYCAVARQCFINQYVFTVTEAEANDAQQLRTALDQALAAGQPYPPLWLATVGAYFPLHTLSNAAHLFDRSAPECVNALFVQQVMEPAEEHELAVNMPVLTEIDGEVSRAVRQQYEESPYPRWVKAALPGQPAIFARPRQQSPDILIAGCGTGLSTIAFAREMPHARVLAIDLSLASLGYAKRMARSFGLANLEFGQADILRLGSIGRKFDIIDASGVLHHLADPWAGWRVLLSLLRPGGMMQVGLYSEFARKNVVAARALIVERGYPATPEGIRRCREDIMAAEDGSLLKSILNWQDFFATNECRDLLFHVQEHRVTLPEVKSFLAVNGMQFVNFNLIPSAVQAFAARFSEPGALTDLDRWHAFEAAAPDTFAAMYQFWIRKPA